MKLQKQLAYRYKNKEYFKHVLTVPDDALKKLGWKSGEKLVQTIENGKLIISRESPSPVQRLTRTEGE